MNPLKRIASLHRELAEAYEALDAQEREKPRTVRKTREPDVASRQAVTRIQDTLRRNGVTR